MTTHITKTWFDGEKVVMQEIPESEVYKQEPVAWDVFELRLYGAPQEKQHRVLWVDRYTHQDGSTPDLDGLLEAAKKDGGIDGGAKTLYIRPLYTTPPPCPTCEALARSVMMDQTGRDA